MEVKTAPARQLKTNRSLGMYILFSVLTLGIYAIYTFTVISSEINISASRYDGKKTMNYLLVILLFGVATLTIVPMIWSHRIANRIGNEARRRGVDTDFSATTFWLWNILGLFIFIGPFVYTYKLFQAQNALNKDYNING